MAYIDSNLIQMFPSANRNPVNDPTSRLTTEYNMVNLVNRLINNNNDSSFVITQTLGSGDNSIEFSLAGYYFRIDNYNNIVNLFQSESPAATDIYAKVEISQSRYFSEIVATGSGASSSGKFPLDTSDGFVGLEFVKDQPASASEIKWLHIMHKKGSTWEIPKESQVKFILHSPMGKTPTLYIDDGELETTSKPETTPL